MRTLVLIPFLAPLLAASALAAPQAQPLDNALAAAKAEQASAEAETARLEKAAAGARDEAQKLRAEQVAAARAIDASEARITAADLQYRLAAAYVAAHRDRLAKEQRPVSSLLAGLAVMARRPPMLALADGRGSDDLVKIGVLLDSTLPVIRGRTRALSAQLVEGQRMEAVTMAARAELVNSRKQLASRREQFAALEQQALERSLSASERALGSGDAAIAAGEQVERLTGDEAAKASARQIAALLASEGAAPQRPFGVAAPGQRPPFRYALPVNAPVLEGVGSVNESGVRSRGISFATVRGAAVIAPADGAIVYSGPFHDYDGILIIDHGGGWLSLIVNAASPLKRGDRVRLGDSLGRALGPTLVELSQNGHRFSPALIAGSSQTLSNDGKGG